MRLSSLLGSARPSSSGWWRVTCPYCPSRVGKEDRKSSLGVRSDSGYYHCFRCGVTGHLRGDEMHSFPDRTAPEAPPDEALQPPPGYVPLYAPPGVDAMCLAPARAYLARRVPPKRWAAWRLGACIEGRCRGRVVVPVLAPDGGWVGWVARDYTGTAEIPHLFARGMRRGEIVFNQRALLADSDDPVFAVEGVFDAMAFDCDGIAFLGKPTEDQIDALAAGRRPVVCVLDGDAHREGWALAMRLRVEGQRAGSVRLPPCVDPDEMPEAVRACAHAAVASEEGEVAVVV